MRACMCVHVCVCVCVVGGAVGPCRKLTSRLLSPPPRPCPARHHPEDEERLPEDGGRDGPAGHQHGGDHRLQCAHQRHPAGPPRAHHQASRWALPPSGCWSGPPRGSGADTTCPRPPGVHALLRKLQFLFELPSRLTKCVELGAYGQAVRYQGRARAVLQQYQHLPSFRAIQDDCQVITARLAQQLRQRFRCGPGTLSHPQPGPWARQLRSRLVPLRPPARIRSACP